MFRLTTFGESHGPAIGGVIEGCPSGVKVDFQFIDTELQRRKTASSETVSQRMEPDQVEWLSGLLRPPLKNMGMVQYIMIPLRPHRSRRDRG